MSLSPQISYFDGSGSTSQLTLTTNLLGLNFSGTVDPNTIDVQINVNGNGWVSDPSLVGLSLPNFTVPNLSSFPSGIQLGMGLNSIQLRSVDLNGSVSSVSTITITVVPDTDLLTAFSPPTGVELRRRASTVDITWSDVNTVSAIGYNVYASTGSGGTDSGYLKINQNIIPISSPQDKTVAEDTMLSINYDFQDSDTEHQFQIITQSSDVITGEVNQILSETSWPLFTSPNFRFSGQIKKLTTSNLFRFNHDRNANLIQGILNNDVFSIVNKDSPLFYVVTSVYYDKITGSLVESRYSLEMSGAPLPLDTTVRGIRTRDQKTVADAYILEVARGSSDLALIPGSSVREVHIEPFANEVQKAYFLMDFVHRAKSFAALLAVDDPTMSGTSVPVANSAYKQNLQTALSINDPVAVQALIDGAFDSLGQNFGITRGGARQATVLQTFYTLSKPTRDIVISQNAIVTSSKNANAPRFISQGQATMVASNAQSYYNPNTRRYEIKVQLVADTPGSAGNVPAGVLDTVTSGASGFQTVNTVASDFGQDQDSNLDVAENASRALTSLDTGTAGGYERISSSTPGVLQAKVVIAGDSFMMRDWDPIRQKHTGGKVDIYVKGTNERTITESFAFQFSVSRSMRFDVIDATNLIFRARDSRLAPNNPIEAMLFNPAQNLGLRNHSNFPTASYDLTGVNILDYRTIQLSTLIPQSPTHVDDFVEGDYRYRSNNRFTAQVQPILRVASVTGEVSGTLDPVSGYILYKLQDPLLDGESTIATDFLSINQVGGVPAGNSIQISNELHVVIGAFEEPLGSVGINELTVAVYSSDRSIQYNGASSSSPDYFIIPGSQTTPVKIIRSSLSAIPSGAILSVDYEHDENFLVTYIVNDTVNRLQNTINKTKHATADVLVKQALENPLSSESTVQLLPNAVQSQVDDNIRTSLTLLTDGKGIGQAINQSQVTTKFQDQDGVDFVVQPFTKFTLQNGAVRIRESLNSAYIFMPTISSGNAAVYMLDDPLPFNTIDGGGDFTVFHGVFQDNIIMPMATSVENVSDSIGQAWIIGAQGAVIPGYSDVATMTTSGIALADQPAEFLKLTANRILVSLNFGLTPPDVPTNHAFSATYIVHGDTGAKDISVSSIEYLTPGDATITYREA